MSFNSFVFLLFFAVVYAGYLLLARHHRFQNRLLLAASYFFYGWWDWRFLFLIAGSTAIVFLAGRGLARTERGAVRICIAAGAVAADLGALVFFKYFNFFAESLVRLCAQLGLQPGPITLHVVLPVGISFYTFQTIGYTLDVYRRQVAPAAHVLDFALFVSFFPQLVAGPIERAGHLLAQVVSPRMITAFQVHAGVWLVLWGYFKKLVIADNMAPLANMAFQGTSHGIDAGIGLAAFALQIYCDFSGYSDIARGCARLMGFELMENFRLPYFARDPAEFWRRWHVSLSTWFRDYVYIPLGGSRCAPWRRDLNIMVTMSASGLWHGASWHFVLWGAYLGLALVAFRRMCPGRTLPPEPARPPWRERLRRRAGAALGIGATLAVVLSGWVLFGARDMPSALGFAVRLCEVSSDFTANVAYRLVFFAAPLVCMECFLEYKGDPLAFTRTRWWLRIPGYAFLLTWILLFGARDHAEFIYFQF